MTEENEPSGNTGETPSSGGGIQITATVGEQEAGGGDTQQEQEATGQEAEE